MELALEPLVLLVFLDTLLDPPEVLPVFELSLVPPETLEPEPELAVPEDSLAELLLDWRATMTPTMTPITARTTTTPVIRSFVVTMAAVVYRSYYCVRCGAWAPLWQMYKCLQWPGAVKHTAYPEDILPASSGINCFGIVNYVRTISSSLLRAADCGMDFRGWSMHLLIVSRSTLLFGTREGILSASITTSMRLSHSAETTNWRQRVDAAEQSSIFFSYHWGGCAKLRYMCEYGEPEYDARFPRH